MQMAQRTIQQQQQQQQQQQERQQQSCSEIAGSVRLLNYFGARAYSLSSGCQTRHASEAQRSSRPLFSARHFTYFAFAILDADGVETPLLAECTNAVHSKEASPAGLLYSFEPNHTSRVVGRIKVHPYDSSCSFSSVRIDLARLSQASPAFALYKPHNDSRRSLLRRWQLHRDPTKASFHHFSAGQEAAITHSEESTHGEGVVSCTLHDLMRSTSSILWHRPASLLQCDLQQLLAIEADPQQFGALMPRDPDAAQRHIRMMSALSDVEALQLEVEERVAYALNAFAERWQLRKITPLSAVLVDLQPLPARRLYAQQLLHCSREAGGDGASSSAALLPDLEAIVLEYAGLPSLPVMPPSLQPDLVDPQWHLMHHFRRKLSI
jgi:hypothetical protein